MNNLKKKAFMAMAISNEEDTQEPLFSIIQIENNAEASWVWIRVNVPGGESVQVQIIKTGDAPYAEDEHYEYEAVEGITTLLVQEDLNETISNVKDYLFGIGIPLGDESDATRVELVLDDVESYNVTRAHTLMV